MRTSFDLPEALLEEARKEAGTRTKTQTLILALNEMVQKRKSRKILELKGSMSGNYDYRPFRKKR